LFSMLVCGCRGMIYKKESPGTLYFLDDL